MTHYLPKQWLGHPIQINQINRPSCTHCKCTDQFHFLTSSQCLVSRNGQVQITVRILTTCGNRTKQYRENYLRKMCQHFLELPIYSRLRLNDDFHYCP